MASAFPDSVNAGIVPALLLGASLTLSSCIDAAGGSREAVPSVRYAISGAESEAERRLVSELISETQGIVRSPAFRRNLAALEKRHPTIFVRRGQPDQPLPQVVEGVTGGWQTAHYPPVRIVLLGSADPNSEDYQRAGTGKPPLGVGSVPIRLGRGIVADYRSADVVTQSCAVNTLAHELIHAISSTPVIFTPAFQDTRRGEAAIVGRSDPHSAVASYLIGSVAQCTWLESKGRIPRWAVPDCVEVFGHRSFNWKRCPAFPAMRPVRLDVDLPPPNEAL